METINERVRAVRKNFGLTQQKFAERLGTAQTTIATAESEGRGVSNMLINSICRTFHVNETWLRDGTGDMISATSRQDEISEFLGSTLDCEPDDFKVRFVSMLARLDAEDWKVLAKMAQLMVDDNEKKE